MKDIKRQYESLSAKQRELLELQMSKGRLSNLLQTEAPKPGHSAVTQPREESEGNAEADRTRSRSEQAMQFSLFFFSDDGSKDTKDKYRLILESAKFADAHGFSALWTPERHFQDFGGLYPNPSVLSAAVAMVTKRIHLRAGSVALPLHNPIRVAEEWAVVDNLSNGRVGISFASGWHPLDFVLSPCAYHERRDLLSRNIDVVRRLWAGDEVMLPGAGGEDVAVRVLPRPIQPTLPTWLSVTNKTESWAMAGRLGVGVLTALVKQPLELLASNIKLYREALAENGHDARAGQVTVMLHTFVGEDDGVVKATVREPLTRYLRNNIKQLGLQTDTLMREMHTPSPLTRPAVSEGDLDAIAAYAFERYFETILLCGAPAKCARLIDRLAEVGVGEVACFVDFGLSFEEVMGGLSHLDLLRSHYRDPAR